MLHQSGNSILRTYSSQTMHLFVQSANNHGPRLALPSNQDPRRKYSGRTYYRGLGTAKAPDSIKLNLTSKKFASETLIYLRRFYLPCRHNIKSRESVHRFLLNFLPGLNCTLSAIKQIKYTISKNLTQMLN